MKTAPPLELDVLRDAVAKPSTPNPLAQGGGERAGAEEEDTTGHISVFVGNLGDHIDE
jgi:hypothetical protein